MEGIQERFEQPKQYKTEIKQYEAQKVQSAAEIAELKQQIAALKKELEAKSRENPCFFFRLKREKRPENPTSSSQFVFAILLLQKLL